MREITTILVFALAFIAIAFASGDAFTPLPESAVDIRAIRAQFEQEISEEGGATAYQRFLKERPIIANEHVSAHLFGESLYTQEGISGVLACGPEFEYGCFHGFFIRALAVEGLSIVDRLNAACRGAATEASPDCLHGIGHGLTEFMGPEKLEEVLALCKSVEPALTIEGCLSGAFMEYNVPRVVAEDGTLQIQVRPLTDSEDPLEPCLSVDAEFQAACYHELPRWWKELFKGEYDKLGALCNSAPSAALRTTCFHGLGVVASNTGTLGSAETIRRCYMIYEEEGRSLCLRVGAGLVQETGDTYHANVICAALPYSEQQLCPRKVLAE